MAEQTSSDLQIESQSTVTHETARNIPDDLINTVLAGPAGTDYTTPSSWAVVKLPQFFLLKGHNGKYLRAASSQSQPWASTFIGDDKMDATVFEAVALSDGSTGIKSTFYGRFLAFVQGRGVEAKYTTTAELDKDWCSRFWPVKLGRGTDSRLIGLRLFRRRASELRCYSAGPTMSAVFDLATKIMGFEVEEAVSQRQIYGVTYHTDRAKTSDPEPLTSVTKDVKNLSKTPQKGVLSFSHTEKESHSWTSTDSFKTSMSVEMSAGIPFLGASITTEAYFSGSYEWGEEQETAKVIGTQIEVEVPGMSMVQATMIVQKGKLEVPFSYGQRDTLYNGNTSLSEFPDGLFTSVNTNVTYETIKRSLA